MPAKCHGRLRPCRDPQHQRAEQDRSGDVHTRIRPDRGGAPLLRPAVNGAGGRVGSKPRYRVWPRVAWIAICWRWRHNAVMAMRVTIRGVLEEVRHRLARCTAQQRRSMQESLRGERGRITSRPSVGEWLQRVHERKEAAGSRVSFRSSRNPAAEIGGVGRFGARGAEATVSANDMADSEFILKEQSI